MVETNSISLHDDSTASRGDDAVPSRDDEAATPNDDALSDNSWTYLVGNSLLKKAPRKGAYFSISF